MLCPSKQIIQLALRIRLFSSPLYLDPSSSSSPPDPSSYSSNKIINLFQLIQTNFISQYQRDFKQMANVHGFRDIREQQRGRGNPRPMGQVGGEALANGPLQQQYRQNRIPFLRALQSDRPPLDETVPYTLKLIWCPTIKPYHPSFIYLLAIWVLYIICLTQGINTKTGVLTIDGQVLIDFGAMKRNLLENGELWRLITAAFLHVDLLHITMNSLSILFFMTRLECIYHPAYILLLIIVSAISGNILSAFNGYNVISAGSSTVIFGVLGVYVAYMFMNWEALAELRTQLCCIIGIIVFLSIISSFSTGVDYLGHLGGIIGGFFLSLAAFPTILPKKKWVMGLGAGGLSGYFLTTFLVFFL